MKKFLKKFLRGTVILLSVILIAVIVLVFIIFTQKNLVKKTAEKYINNNLDIPVQIGKLNYSFFPLSFEIEDIQLSYPIGKTEIKINLKKLSGTGDIHRLRKGRKPYLDTLVIDGLEIDAQIKRTGKVIYWHELRSNLSRALSFIRCLDLKNSLIKLRLDEIEALAEDVNFLISPDEKEGNYLFLLNASATEVSASPGRMLSGNSGKLKVSGMLELSQTPALLSSLSLAGINLFFDRKPLVKEDSLEGKIKLFLSPDKNILSFLVQELSLPNNVHLTAQAEADFDKAYYSFSPEIYFKESGKWLELLEPYLPETDIDWKKLNLSGSTKIRGEGFVNGRENIFSFSGYLSLGPLELSYDIPGIKTKAQIRAGLDFTAGRDKTEAEGLLTLSGGSLRINGVSLNGLELKTLVSYSDGELILDGVTFSGTMEETAYEFMENKINLPPVNFKGEAGLNFPSMKASLYSFILSFPGLSPLTAEAKAAQGIRGEKTLSFYWPGIEIKKVLEIFPEIMPESLLSWEVEGKLGLQARLKQKGEIGEKPWEIDASLELSELAFNNPDFTIASDAISSRINFRSELLFPLDKIPFSLDFKVSRGESLWKTYYLNWEKFNLGTKLEGNFFPSEKNLQDLSIKLGLGELAAISAAGNLNYENEAQIDIETALNLSDPAGIQEILTGGELSYDMQGNIKTQTHLQGKKENLKIKGLLQLENFSLKDEKKGLSIEKIEASVPFQILTTDYPQVTPEEKIPGFIFIDNLEMSGFFLESIRLDIQSKPGLLIIKPASFKLGGGKITVEETYLNYFPEFKLSSSLYLEKTKISSLLPNLELPFQGTMLAEFPSFYINREQLKTEGDVEIDIFEGKVKIDNIGVINPFSKNRTVLTDITFSDINLEKVTDLVPFGRVTGIVNGEVKDLAVSYGQPESFFLFIESEKKKGIPQLFSLKAADDISVIGTGSESALSSSSWLTKFVDNFRYQKIGISCSLKNDIFTLNGTIREKGNEYLVKGSWLFGINVVNKMPRNTIRFKDMLDRLKRIGKR